MNDRRIAVSTCALPGQTVADIDTLAWQNDWLMEFSSGFKPAPDLVEQFRQARCRKLIHNYFPPPMEPFVLNLASVKASVWEQSVEHARRALRLAQELAIPFYSVHAGYGVDPEPSHLGRPIPADGQVSREAYWTAFLKAIRVLLQESDRCGVDLYIENNVIIADNRQVPLLCTTPAETLRMVQEIAHSRFGVLLDTGHAKVSGQTLGFKPTEFVDALGAAIKAIHHNENDGLRDTNDPLGTAYWFLPFMPRFKTAWHVIEVVKLTPQEIQAQIQILASAMRTGVAAC